MFSMTVVGYTADGEAESLYDRRLTQVEVNRMVNFYSRIINSLNNAERFTRIRLFVVSEVLH